MDRVPREDKKDVAMNFRVSAAEKVAWEAEAARQKVTVSRLIRYVVNEYCERRKKAKK